MKPKNKFQKQVFELSKKLPMITEAQYNWAVKHCFDRYARRTKGGLIYCLECGEKWKSKQTLIDSICGCTCPNCRKELKIYDSLKQNFTESQYFCIISTCENMQVFRYFFLTATLKVGRQAHYECREVVQRWIAPNGKSATISLLRKMSTMYYDLWNFNSNLEIRKENDCHNITPAQYYPRSKFIPEIIRGGFKNEYNRHISFTLFRTLLSDSRAETLLKAGQTEVLKYFAGKQFHYISGYWSSIKICIRNGYNIKNASDWKDYIDLLHFFRKDLHNAKYVCPADLTAEHDRYVKKKREYQERESRKEAREQALTDEARFKKMKSRFFGIRFDDGVIRIRVLESVKEIMQEGDILHHCVFANEYHLKPDSLILSACIGEKRIETIEFSLSEMRVVQSRGLQNKNSEYHERIVNLVNENSRLIRKRMAA